MHELLVQCSEAPELSQCALCWIFSGLATGEQQQQAKKMQLVMRMHLEMRKRTKQWL